MVNSVDIAVIGGGAAGFFAAVHASNGGKNKVVILEKANKVLTKVLVSGGGRCNVTHACSSASQLASHYPRGGKKLKKSFALFGSEETVNWFESRNVPLKTEADGRMFPVSNNSKSIADCLLKEVDKLGIELRLKHDVKQIEKVEKGFLLRINDEERLAADKVIVSAGGFSKKESYAWLEELGLEIIPPIPSLFTFNVPHSDYKPLMGVSVNEGLVQVPGSKLKETGPVLITHWGFSGPAVIKLSAWAAVDLHKRNYHFPVMINWTGKNEAAVREELDLMRKNHPAKVVLGNSIFAISQRLWEQICAKAEITPGIRYSELSAKKANVMVELLVRSPFEVRGKTTFKEEFVTCGGVALSEVDLETFQSKKIPNLYFAGEVLDVDGVTGGFNFQHAWTSGYLAGTHAAATI